MNHQYKKVKSTLISCSSGRFVLTAMYLGAFTGCRYSSRFQRDSDRRSIPGALLGCQIDILPLKRALDYPPETVSLIWNHSEFRLILVICNWLFANQNIFNSLKTLRDAQKTQLFFQNGLLLKLPPLVLRRKQRFRLMNSI